MRYLNFLFVISVLFLFSCQNTEDIFIPQDSINQDSNPVIAKLIQMGFDKEQIKEFDDYFLVEGDLMFSKNIDDYSFLPNVLSKQAYNNGNLLDLSQTYISVYVDSSIPSSGTDDWRSALNLAIIDWNSIPSSSVHFYLSTSSQADITVKSDPNLPFGTIAKAGFPKAIYGHPFGKILISLNYNYNETISESRKRRTLVHELGHCIGLRHTNWNSRNERFASTIPGTSGNDPASVMNGGIPGNWTGFSSDDVIAAQYLFPYSAKADYENVYYSQDPFTIEVIDDVYVKLYTDGTNSTPLSLPILVKYSILTQYTEGQSAGSAFLSSYSKTITSGSQNRYFLTADVTREYCEYDYGDPIGDCYERWVRF